MSSESSPFWERLVLSVAATVIAAGILGVYSAIASMGGDVRGLGEAQAVMQSQITDVRAAIQGIYTRREAEADKDVYQRTNADQYARLDDHEQRIRRLETHKR